MDHVELKKLAREFNISKDECYNNILSISNKNSIKLLHKINNTLIIPKILYNKVVTLKDDLESELVDLETIKENRKDTIPFNNNCYIYFLFNNNDLIYIGQTTNVALRISSHNSDGKNFNYVSTIKTNNPDLLLVESLYIYREQPPLNTAILSDKDYQKLMLKQLNYDHLLQ